LVQGIFNKLVFIRKFLFSDDCAQASAFSGQGNR